jgi:hypothetical protein
LDRSSSSICLAYAKFCTSIFRMMAVRRQFIRCLASRGKELRCLDNLAISPLALSALGPCTFCSRAISCPNDTKALFLLTLRKGPRMLMLNDGK